MRNPILLSVFTAISLACNFAEATDLHVDQRNSGSEDGSASHPFRTVQRAVNAASNGDHIRVAAGTYQESVSISEKGLFLEGGFPGASESTYTSGGSGDFAASDPSANPTVVRGSSGSTVLRIYGTVETVVDGVVLTGGKIGIDVSAYPELNGKLTVRRSIIENNGSASSWGGGIQAETVLVIEDSVVRGNVGERGSGISSRKAAVSIVRSVIDGNVSYGDHGGGIYAAGQVVIHGCLIVNNRVGENVGYGWGGGLIVFNSGTSATITDTEIRGNYAPTKGSGLFVDDGAVALIRNVLVADNECSQNGGAVYIDGLNESLGSTATLINVTVVGHNCGDSSGNALLIENASDVTVDSCIFWNNGSTDTERRSGTHLTVKYSDSRDSFPGDGNISQDPLFVNPAAGDYHLKSQAGRWDSASDKCIFDSVTSPCVDTGNPAGAFDREPEPNGGRVDMGAYGNSLGAGCSEEGGGGFGGDTSGGAGGGWGGSGGSGSSGSSGSPGSGGSGPGNSGAGGSGTSGSGQSNSGNSSFDGDADGGCGCRVSGSDDNRIGWVIGAGLGIVGLGAVRRRRMR